MPSGVKTPTSMLQLGGAKPPTTHDVPDIISAPPVSAPSPDVDASEPPAPQVDPAPEPADVPERTVEQRISTARTDEDARTSTPQSLVRDGRPPLTAEQTTALTEYLGENYQPINHILRGGDPSRLRGMYVEEDDVRAWIDSIDESMAVSRLPDEIAVWRGLSAGNTRLFGDAFDGDLTGFEWREDSYASTSTDLAISANFAGDLPGATLMRVVVPAGTGAVELSDASYESEILLERGLRMRVVADHGVDEDGIRRLDLEVIRDGT